MAKGWKFILGDSSDMSTIRDMRQVHDRTLSVDLNKSGSASGSVAMADKASRLISPWSTCLIAQYDDEPYWSGPISNIRRNWATGRVTFNAVGWFDRLMSLLIQDFPGVTYTTQDAGYIAQDLLSKAREQDGRLVISMGSTLPTQPRTITYNRDQNIGQAIAELAQLESGYDWYIDPMTRRFNIVARIGENKKTCKWTFLADDMRQGGGADEGYSDQSTLADLDDFEDGTTIVNWIAPRGKNGTIEPAQDVFSQAQYGVFQEAPSLSDVVDANILNAYANAEIVYRSRPRVTYTMTPKPSTKDNVPKLFRDFNIGDTTYLTARRDGHTIGPDQAVRIFGATLAIADNGVETLSNLQTEAN